MKDAAKQLWEQLEAEASDWEDRVRDLELEIPPDAKSPEEMFEELMKQLRAGAKSTFSR